MLAVTPVIADYTFKNDKVPIFFLWFIDWPSQVSRRIRQLRSTVARRPREKYTNVCQRERAIRKQVVSESCPVATSLQRLNLCLPT